MRYKFYFYIIFDLHKYWLFYQTTLPHIQFSWFLFRCCNESYIPMPCGCSSTHVHNQVDAHMSKNDKKWRSFHYPIPRSGFVHTILSRIPWKVKLKLLCLGNLCPWWGIWVLAERYRNRFGLHQGPGTLMRFQDISSASLKLHQTPKLLSHATWGFGARSHHEGLNAQSKEIWQH